MASAKGQYSDARGVETPLRFAKAVSGMSHS